MLIRWFKIQKFKSIISLKLIKRVLQRMIIYGLKNCDACKTLLKAQPQFELVDVSITPVPENLLNEALKIFGEKLINKSSTTWRKLDTETREQKPLDIIRLNPKVMKRPLVQLKSGELLLGSGALKD
jgi:arsenate reductase|tara:strand:- start:93 stop:473 length:381 start_codon:yes stop_codon:yes gene_type:complete